MIWVVLAFLGVPLWLCALAILTLVLRNRRLRTRHGDIPVRVRRQGKHRWARGHAIWVSDVFAWRGSPAAWKEDLFQVVRLTPRVADGDERKRLRRFGDDPVIVTLAMAEGGSIDVAATSDRRFALLGPFATIFEEA
jgi:hypothetical protein